VVGRASVANHQLVAVLVAAIIVNEQKLIDFGLDRSLQHSRSSIVDDLIERTSLVELSSSN